MKMWSQARRTRSLAVDLRVSRPDQDLAYVMPLFPLIPQPDGSIDDTLVELRAMLLLFFRIPLDYTASAKSELHDEWEVSELSRLAKFLLDRYCQLTAGGNSTVLPIFELQGED